MRDKLIMHIVEANINPRSETDRNNSTSNITSQCEYYSNIIQVYAKSSLVVYVTALTLTVI